MKKLSGVLSVLVAVSMLLSACAGAASEPAPLPAEAPDGPAPAPEPEKTDAELAAFFSSAENMYLLDLSLPLMEEGYVDADTAACARSAALGFTRYVRTQEEEDVLSSPGGVAGGGEELVRLKNAWLNSIGAEEDYVPFAPLPFERSTIVDADVYPFMVRGKYANWYFSVEDVREQGYVGFLSSFLQFSELAEQDFADARAFLQGHIPDDTPPVKICVGFHRGNVNTSWIAAEFQYADDDHNRIQLYHGWDEAAYSLLHEYVHYLRRGSALRAPFCVEAVTEEISTFECENGLRRLQSHSPQDVRDFRSLGLWDRDHDCLNMRNSEMLTAASYYLGLLPGSYLSVAGYAVSHPDKMSWNYLSYEEGSCMAWYMMGLYGKDAVLSCRTKEDLDLLIGKPVDEFYNEFGAWLLEQRAVYGWG